MCVSSEPRGVARRRLRGPFHVQVSHELPCKVVGCAAISCVSAHLNPPGNRGKSGWGWPGNSLLELGLSLFLHPAVGLRDARVSGAVEDVLAINGALAEGGPALRVVVFGVGRIRGHGSDFVLQAAEFFEYLGNTSGAECVYWWRWFPTRARVSWLLPSPDPLLLILLPALQFPPNSP